MQKLRKYLIISLIIVSLNFILFHDRKEYLSENNILGVYVDNELQESIPKKGEVMFSKAICDNDNVNYYWDVDNWGLFVDNLNKKTKCNLYFVDYSGQTVFDFDYTGAEQTFTVPVSGTYKLETWGAQGGNDISGTQGGYGGFSNGDLKLNENEKIYINVGSTDLKKCPIYNKGACFGGYNGGGDSFYFNNEKWGSGGGATHISLKSGLLSSLENNVSSILMVSGAGGGAYYKSNGGSGGGYKGNDGKPVNNYKTALGGTQNSGGLGSVNGTFGLGGICTENGLNCAGGGGGFYGGAGADATSGAGGSGYIGNPLLTNKVMYCYNCEESSEENTKTISTTCNEETPTSNCAKKGNGYARITLVSIDE